MAPRDQDKVSARLLRQSLGDPGDACPEPEILAAYFERSLDAEETARYERHFSQCARCREQIAAMDRAAESVLAGRSDTRQAARWAWLWDWRVVAPVTALLILAAVWIVRQPAARKVAEIKTPPPLVAMNGPSDQAAAPQAAPEATREPKVASPNTSATGERALQPQEKQELDVAKQQSQAQNQLQLDELRKKESVAKRDSGIANGNGAAIGGAAASTAAPAAPSPAPPALVADASAVPAPSAQRVTVESAVQGTSAPVKAKSASSSNYESALTQQTQAQQVQVQTVTQAQAVTLAAVEKHPAGNVIATPDPKVLWRIVAGTAVELSKDGGATWKKQQLRSFEANPQITAGFAPTVKICWLVGRDGVILLTRDAAHWVPIPPPVNTDFVGVTAQDNFSATITAADGRKFSTEDAGDHWNPAP